MPVQPTVRENHDALIGGETLPHKAESAAAERSEEHLHADPTMHQSAPYQEPAKVRSGVLALLVHMLLFAVLMFGVSWRRPEPTPVVYVDLWSAPPGSAGLPGSGGAEGGGQARYSRTPATAVPTGPAEPPSESAGRSESLHRPDIGFTDREDALERKRESEESPKSEGKRHAVKPSREAAAAREATSGSSFSTDVAGAGRTGGGGGTGDGLGPGTGTGGASNSRLAELVALIRSNTYIPPEVPGSAEVVYEVTLLPTGEVLETRLVKSSGIASYDASAERAIRKSSPLPVPTDDPIVFQTRYRVMVLHFRPDE